MLAAKVAILIAKLASGIPISEADLLGLLEEALSPELSNPMNWALRGSIQYSKTSIFEPLALAHKFNGRYIKVATVASGVSECLYLAGWLTQTIAGNFSDAQVSNRGIPLNRESIFTMPKLSEHGYNLVFTPRLYLFNLRVDFYEWTGQEPDRDKIIEGLL